MNKQGDKKWYKFPVWETDSLGYRGHKFKIIRGR